jgi:hypothetical protein
MMERYTQAADAAREGERDFAVPMAGVMGIFGVFAVLVWLIMGSLFLDWEAVKIGLVVIVALTGFAVGGIISTGVVRGWIYAGRILGQIIQPTPKPSENPVTPPAPAALPALPAASDTIRVTRNGVGEDIPRNLLHGFDERDLLFLCRLLSVGFKFTEASMEKLVLPYSHDVMGKADEGTPYSRFMDLCVSAGVIEGREPKKSGRMAVTEYAEIVRRIKELQNTPTP